MDAPALPPVTLAEEAARITITLGVDLDQTAGAELLAAGRKAVESGLPVMIGCANTPFLPTAVVQILFALRRACRERGVTCTPDGVHESAAGYLRLAGLDSLFLS